MELRQLEYFCTVSSLKNFTKAAHILHVSQPSVTKAIQALEAELNLLLFDRSQKHIALTEAGQVFLLHAKKILQNVQTAQLSMERFQTQNGGVIKIGVPPMVESYLFPSFFMKFQTLYPDILLDLRECSDSISIKEKLESDFLDFGIVLLSVEETLENSVMLSEGNFYLCIPQNHKLINEKKVTFSQLSGEKFILQPKGTIQNFFTMKLATDAGFAPDVLLSTSQLKTIEALVAGGVAISLLPNFVLKESKSFKVVPLNPPIKFKILLAWSRFKELSSLGIRFLNIFNEVLKSREEKS